MLARPVIHVLLLVPCIPLPLIADETQQRDETVLREAGVGTDGPALLDFFRQRTPTDAQRKQILELVKQLGDDSFRVRRQAATRLEGFGQAAVGLLKRAQDSEDPQIARQCSQVVEKIEKVPSEVVAAAVARMLGRVRPEGTLEVILAQLPSADDEQVADALRWALVQAGRKNGQPEPKLVAALTDDQPARRAAAAEALLKLGAIGLRPDVRKLLNDPDFGVRLRTALVLVTSGREKESVANLIDVLPLVPASQVWQAEEVLRHLAGDDAPRVSLVGDAATREQARKAWGEWWAKHRDTVNLARLDELPRSLGYTLVLSMEPNGAQGEAREFAPDGKSVRWQIKGLQLPVDAQVLPEVNRVLLAEYNGQSVTERDFNGKVERRWTVSEPVACQRTPDGHTFIAHRNGLVEYGPTDQRVFSSERNMGDIVTAQKARDGTYIFVTRTGLCTRMNAQGKTVRTFNVGRPYYFSGMELLPNNRILVTQMTGVAEYDLATGKMEWSATGIRNPTSVSRLPNGHTLVSSTMTRKIVELDADGKQAKEFPLADGAVPWRVKRR